VRHAIKLLRDEIDRDMALVGITTLAEMRRKRLTAARGAEFLAADERQWTPTRSRIEPPRRQEARRDGVTSAFILLPSASAYPELRDSQQVK
jgi:hypothetical protein